MKPGDIVYINTEKGAPGVDTPKRRPYLILAVTPNDFGQDAVVLVAFITGTDREPSPTDIMLEDWKELGLTKPSVLRCRQISTVARHHVVSQIKGRPLDIGTLREAQEIARALLA